MILRLALPTDALEILNIYSPYILNSAITFENTVPNLSSFEKRIAACLISFPWIVAIQDGKIAGYAYAYKYREREAYQWAVESSVYIADGYRHKGVAAHLYTALFDILKLQQIQKVYAVITLPNEASVRFHEKCGFAWFATYNKVGYKLGKWHNVGWWQLDINTDTAEPALPIAFSAIAAETIANVLKKLTVSDV